MECYCYGLCFVYGEAFAYVPKGERLYSALTRSRYLFVLRSPHEVYVQRSSLQCLLLPGFSVAIQGFGNWASTLLPDGHGGCLTGFSSCIKVDGGRMEVAGIRYWS